MRTPVATILVGLCTLGCRDSGIDLGSSASDFCPMSAHAPIAAGRPSEYFDERVWQGFAVPAAASAAVHAAAPASSTRQRLRGSLPVLRHRPGQFQRR
jgi:hypothetical protein